MRILYLAHRIPYPPDKGDKMRAYRHLTHLCASHDVSCACFVDNELDEKHVEHLRTLCRNVGAIRLNRKRALVRGVIGMMRGRTVTESFYDHPEMWSLLRSWSKSEPFDVVVAFSSSMAPYAHEVQAKRRVLDLCDLDSAKWTDYAAFAGGPLHYAYRVEGQRLAERERTWASQFDAVSVITEAEARDLRAIASQANVSVLTNGVEFPEIGALELVGSDGSAAIGSRSSWPGPTIGFVGVMDYLPNVDAVCSFVDECWDAIRSRFPLARFRVAGRRPTRAVRRLARVPGVEVVGEVQNVSGELRSFDVSVAPLRIARGLQNKVLEAMAHGVPVVASEAVARGVDATQERDYLVANGSDAIIRHVNRLLSDPELRARVGQNGRAFVADRHRWIDALRRFELLVTGTQSVAHGAESVTYRAESGQLRTHQETKRYPVPAPFADPIR